MACERNKFHTDDVSSEPALITSLRVSFPNSLAPSQGSVIAE
jgi:hypothetical protein